MAASRLIKRVGGQWMAKGPGGVSLGLFHVKAEAIQAAQEALDDILQARKANAIEDRATD